MWSSQSPRRLLFLGCLLPALTSPCSDPKARKPPIPIEEAIDGAKLTFAARIDKFGASAAMERYSLVHYKYGKVSKGKEALRHFQYNLASAKCDLLADGSFLLALFATPDDVRWMFPARSRWRVERREGSWAARRSYVVRYTVRGEHLEPRFQDLGGDYPIALEPNRKYGDFEREGIGAVDNLLYGIRQDGQMVTIFIQLDVTSSNGIEWEASDDSPIRVSLESIESAAR